MSNTIDVNLRGKNTIGSLNFLWVAQFKDGTSIAQDEDRVERLFKDVLDKFDELSQFILFNQKNPSQYFLVNLEKGYITQNSEVIPNNVIEKKNIRLIYFRRNIVTMNSNLQEVSRKIIYFLGFQYLNIKGENEKVILQIDNDNGTITIGN